MTKKDYSNWDRNDLIKEIEQLRRRKKYGLVWEDKPEDVVEQCKKELPVLEEVKKKEIITDPDRPVNLLIEGDNYHALSVLNYTHKGKIDVIYIDPPYNTGAKDWKYNNDYVDKNDRWRHSKYLMMMSHRIKLTKNLLNSEGVILVAIDDHEVHNVRHILDDTFGETNYITTICIEVNPAGQNIRQNAPAISHDYCLIYAKSLDKAKLITRELTESEKMSYKFEDINGRYLWDNLRRRGGNSTPKDRPGQWFPLYADYNSKKISLSHFEGSEEVWPIDPKGINRIWRVNPVGFKREYTKGNISVITKSNKFEISKKSYEPLGKKPKTLWKDPKHSATSHGTKLLIQILGTNTFTYPKSLYLIEDCLKYYAGKDALILDFFAGSGTTGHAVLELNEKDGGNRKFILCTNNEVGEKEETNFCKKHKITKEELRLWKNKKKQDWLDWADEYGICTTVTYPRMKNVINGYKYFGNDDTLLMEKMLSESALKDADLILEELEKIKEINRDKYDKLKVEIEDSSLRLYGTKKLNGKKEGLGGNLKYFKTSFVPADPTDQNKIALTEKATEMLCVKEDTFEEVKLTKQYKIFRNKKRYTGIVFDHQVIDEFKKEIAKTDGKFSLYIFSLGDDTFDEEFEDMMKKVKLSPIPEAILRVYRRIFK